MFLPYYKKGVTSIMSFHVKSADRECRPNQPNYFVRRKDLQFLKRTLDQTVIRAFNIVNYINFKDMYSYK